MIPEGFAQITHLFGGSGCPTGAAVVFGISNPGDGGAGPIAEAVHGYWAEEIMPVLSSPVTLLETVVKKGPDNTGASGSFSSPIAGGASGDVNPGVAILVKKNTDLGGRRGRGRMYIPGVDEADVGNGGVITGGALTTLQTAIDSWFDRFLDVVDGGVPVLLHEQWKDSNGNLHPANPADLPDPTPIISFAVQALTATQRRRLRR